MNRPRRIGFFDSGVGGLSVLRHALGRVKGIPLIYVADTAYAPYGGRTTEQVIVRCHRIVDFLIAQGAEAIVVACNTASALAIESLRQAYPQPIIAMEPAVKPAAAVTRSGRIAVLATEGTLRSERYARLVSNHGRSIKVLEHICHHWVEAVESGECSSDATRTMVAHVIHPLQASGVDTFVLGCTHYPFLSPVIACLSPPGTGLIEPGAAVIDQLQRRCGLSAARIPVESALTAFTSGDPKVLQRQISALIGKECGVASLD